MTANYRVINGITQLSMGESMNEEDVDVIKKTGEKLLELAPNVRLIQDDNTQNALLNGEASVAFLYTSQVTAALAENPDLKVVYPEEGLGFGIMGMFIPSEAPDKDAAYSFMDYIMQPEVAAKCTEYIGYYSTNKAADELVNPDLVVPDDVTKGEIVQNVSQEQTHSIRRTGLNLRLPATKEFNMDIYKGTGAFSGIAIGKILYYHKSEYQIHQYEITDVREELNVFRQARARVMEQLTELYEKNCTIQESQAELFPPAKESAG